MLGEIPLKSTVLCYLTSILPSKAPLQPLAWHTLHWFHFSGDHSGCRINYSVFQALTAHHLLSSKVSAATMHLLVLPGHIFMLLWGIIHNYS